jgi:hypothetical protein
MVRKCATNTLVFVMAPQISRSDIKSDGWIRIRDQKMEGRYVGS